MNVAIIGCGTIARVHAECIQQMEGYRLVAFADTNFERAEQFAMQYHGCAFRSYEEMLKQVEIDIVHICTPHYLHVPMALSALEQGRYVFVEKPPAITREQFLQLEGLTSRKKLGFCFQNRYNPSVIQVKKMLESGKAGNILGARGIVTWNREELYYTQSEWRGRLATEGGGALINQSVHTMDLLTYFLGTPVSVDAVMANHHLKSTIEVEDMMEAFICYEGGKKACFYATTAYIADVPPLIEISCEHMTIRIEDLEVTYYHKDGKVEKPLIENKVSMGKSYWGSGHRDCIADFYRSIESDESFALGLDGIRETVLLMLGTYESARTGKEISLLSSRSKAKL